MNDMHVTRNDKVVAYISLDKIKLIDSKPEDLIYLMKMIIGLKGMLLIPVLEELNNKDNLSDQLTYWGTVPENIRAELNSINRLDTGKLRMFLKELKVKIIGIGKAGTEISIINADNKFLEEFRKYEIPFCTIDFQRADT